MPQLDELKDPNVDSGCFDIGRIDVNFAINRSYPNNWLTTGQESTFDVLPRVNSSQTTGSVNSNASSQSIINPNVSAANYAANHATSHATSHATNYAWNNVTSYTTSSSSTVNSVESADKAEAPTSTVKTGQPKNGKKKKGGKTASLEVRMALKAKILARQSQNKDASSGADSTSAGLTNTGLAKAGLTNTGLTITSQSHQAMNEEALRRKFMQLKANSESTISDSAGIFYSLPTPPGSNPPVTYQQLAPIGNQQSAPINNLQSAVPISHPIYAGHQYFLPDASGPFISYPYPPIIQPIGASGYLQDGLIRTAPSASTNQQLWNQQVPGPFMKQPALSGAYLNNFVFPAYPPIHQPMQSTESFSDAFSSGGALSSESSLSSASALSSGSSFSSGGVFHSKGAAQSSMGFQDASDSPMTSSFNLHLNDLQKAMSAPDLRPYKWKRAMSVPSMHSLQQSTHQHPQQLSSQASQQSFGQPPQQLSGQASQHSVQQSSQPSQPPVKKSPQSTGVFSSPSVMKHHCTCDNNQHHPEENPNRVSMILQRFHCSGLLAKTVHVKGREATLDEIKSTHDPTYVHRWATIEGRNGRLGEKKPGLLNCGGIGLGTEMFWNDHTEEASRSAAGCVIQLAEWVADNQLKNGFAVVRPPGHHAEFDAPNGFCFFNNVAIAAKQLQIKKGLERILILDFDIHHGNGTQNAFLADDEVLYLSLHRFDRFYPGTGAHTECGISPALGKTINIAWPGNADEVYYGDAEYLAAFRAVVLPVIEQWKPEIVLVSCGFDAADGHPARTGGYHLTPAMFGWMINELVKRDLKLVLALEGGFNIPMICDCSEQVLRALLGMPLTRLSADSLDRKPNPCAVDALRQVIALQGAYWSCLKGNESLISGSHRSYQDDRLVVLD